MAAVAMETTKMLNDLKDHNMAPNSKNDDRYQFARAKSTWKPNFAQIGGFLYFGGHFGFLKFSNGRQFKNKKK
jgi:hypothetical protein